MSAFCITILGGNIINAQFYSNFNYYQNYPLKDSLVKKNGIAELIMDGQYFYRKGKSYSNRQIYQYDNDGNNTFACSVSDSVTYKKMYYSNMVNHTNDDKIYGTTTQSNSTFEKNLRLTGYDAEGRISTIHYFNKRGKNTGRYAYFYKDSLLYKQEYFNKRQKLRKYYIYEYENKRRIRTSLYNSKGKISFVWDYTCEETGELKKKSKDTSKFCTSKTYLADGSKIITTNYFNFDGTPIKVVELVDSNGKVLKHIIYRGEKQIVTYLRIKKYSNGKEVSDYYWSGTNKGKHSYSYYQEFGENGQIVKKNDTNYYGNSKKGYYRNYEYYYNAEGLISHSKSYKNGKLDSIVRYRYRYYKKEDKE